MAERYNPNTRKRREPTFGGLDALNQPTQQDTPFFGLEGREQLQGAKRRPTTALPKKKRGFDMPGAQIKPTIPAGEPVKLDPVTGGGHPGAMNVVGSAYDYKFGPKFSSDPGKGRPVPTPPLAKRPWQETRPSPKPTSGIAGGATPYKPKSRADGKLRSSILKEHANISNEAEQEALDEFGYQPQLRLPYAAEVGTAGATMEERERAWNEAGRPLVDGVAPRQFRPPPRKERSFTQRHYPNNPLAEMFLGK